MKFIIFIDGGYGRVVASTGVITEFAKKNDVSIITPYTEIFSQNPHIKRVYTPETSYLYDDVIKDAKYIRLEPYEMYEYYNEKKHIVNCFNIQLNKKDEFIPPIMFFSKQEEIEAVEFINRQENQNGFILFQPWAAPFDPYRSLTPTFAAQLALELNKKHKTYQVSLPEQEPLSMITPIVNTPLKKIICISRYAKAVVGVDSALQHGAKAINKKAIVFWGATPESVFAYKENENIREHKIKYFVPNRLPVNDENAIEKNKGVNEFTNKSIQKVLSLISK